MLTCHLYARYEKKWQLKKADNYHADAEQNNKNNTDENANELSYIDITRE